MSLVEINKEHAEKLKVIVDREYAGAMQKHGLTCIDFRREKKVRFLGLFKRTIKEVDLESFKKMAESPYTYVIYSDTEYSFVFLTGKGEALCRLKKILDVPGKYYLSEDLAALAVSLMGDSL